MQNHLENKAYAGFFVRLVAFAADSIIAGLAVGIVKFPFMIAAVGGVSFLTADFIFDYTVMDVFSYIGVAAYFVLLTYFCHSTPGKLLFRLEVVTKSGEWTFLTILYRETIGRFLSSLLCIGYLAVLVQKDKQGFHDMLCDTYVIYKNMRSVQVTPQRPVPETPQRPVPETPVQPLSDQPVVSAFQMEEGFPIKAAAEPEETKLEASLDLEKESIE